MGLRERLGAALSAVLRVEDGLAPERRVTARYVMGTSLLVALWAGLTTALGDGMQPSTRVGTASIAALFGGAFVVCRNGAISRAVRYYVGGLVLVGAVVVAAAGTRSHGVTAVLAIPILAGLFMRPPVAVLLFAGLAASIVCTEWAIAHGHYEVEIAFDEVPWQPSARQLVFVPLVAALLRLAYDSVQREVVVRTSDAEALTDVAAARNAALESEVAARTSELAARARIKESVAESFARELDTPLGEIAGRLRGVIDASPARRDALRDLTRAADAADRMQRMVARLLEHVRLGSDVTLDETVDIDAMIRSIVENAGIEEPGVVWTIDSFPPLVGDEALIRAAIENLVNNAIKFSRDREPPQIHIGRRVEDGAIFVRDNGVGFDMAYAPKLFKPFQRMHGKQFEGDGVGLANVRRIAELHGGRCWAEAAEGRGATFFLKLGETT